MWRWRTCCPSEVQPQVVKNFSRDAFSGVQYVASVLDQLHSVELKRGYRGIPGIMILNLTIRAQSQNPFTPS